LPDPRRYGAGTSSRALNDPCDAADLRRRLDDLLKRGADAEVADALRAAPTQAAYTRLWQAVCDAANQVGNASASPDVVARIFALPLVIITGSRRPSNLPGVVPDIGAIAELFTQQGAHPRGGWIKAVCASGAHRR